MNSHFFREKNAPIYTPPTGPSAASPPHRELYQLMGEENIKQLLKDFYRKLGQSEIAGMFPSELEAASEEAALFFVGVLGGPPLYHEKYGSPRMRMRHFPFRITDQSRKIWLECFYAALDHHAQYGIPTRHLEGFKQFLASFSQWMVNTAEG